MTELQKMKIQFLVQGSAEIPYIVEFTRHSDSSISTYCTCTAGQQDHYCRHRFSIIEGKTTDIVSENPEEVETVQSWIPGSEIETAMEEVCRLDKEIAKAKELLSSVKDQIVRSLMN